MKLCAAILAFSLTISAIPAFAADDMMTSVTGAAKGAATQAATDKMNKTLGTQPPAATAPVTPTAPAPTVQSVKDQAQKAATDKATQASTNAINGALGK